VVPPITYSKERCENYPPGPLSAGLNGCFMIFPYYPNAGDSLKIVADTARFVYDTLGNLTQANNRYARVRRTYYRGGALKTDTTAIGTLSAPLTDGITRGQQYVYDLSGKRASMQWFLGTNGYSYNDFGGLSTVTDPSSNQYRFVYTLAGQIDSLLLGTGVAEDRNYDADGRLTSRNRVGLVSGTLTYDRMNRVIHSVESSHGQGAEDTRIAYDGLGAVLANEQTSGGGANVEEFRNDALGNVLYRKTQRTAGGNDAPFVLQYNPQGTLRSSSAWPSNPPGQSQRNDDLGQSFAGGGQLIRQNQLVQNPNDGSVSLQLAGRHYYGADDKLMVVQRYSYRSTPFGDGTWEEYWYDALGRRVLTRARRDPSSIYDVTVSGPLCSGGIQCRSFTERVWWDGDQALIEERTPEGTSDVSNSGLVGNIHGLNLDEPLAVRSDQTRIINYNWRGQGESSVFPDGSPADASLGNVSTEIDWPALTQPQTYFTPGPNAGGSGNAKQWMGTFVANGQGTTGMLYRRNRYFDPNSGQFTQADPIGIAGGMNAFGFVEGDPINFNDPFGVCPPDDNNQDDCQNDVKGNRKKSYCPAGSAGTPPNCQSLATKRLSPGSCPNATRQEWGLGQQAIAATGQSNVEEGFAITGIGVVPLTGPSYQKLLGSITAVNGWPSGTRTVVHSHPSGGGISPGDIAATNATGVRSVSAGVRTNRYGSYSKGGIAITCNMPNKP